MFMVRINTAEFVPNQQDQDFVTLKLFTTFSSLWTSRVTSHEPNLVTYYIPFKDFAVKTVSNKRTVLPEQVGKEVTQHSRSKVLNWFHGSLHDSSAGASLVILLGPLLSRTLPVPNLGPMGTQLSTLGREICLMSGSICTLLSPSQLIARLIPSLSRSSTFPIPQIILSFSQKTFLIFSYLQVYHLKLN